jgi:uncharacterized protein (DUF305 family)
LATNARQAVKNHQWRLGVLLLLFAAAAAGAQLRNGGNGRDEAATVSPAWTELTAGMEKMHLAMMAVGPSGNSDTDFVQLMLPHHRAAIDMAKAQLEYGKDPQMRRLAQEIITDQQSEIELMQLWLKQHENTSPHGKPATAVPEREE